VSYLNLANSVRKVNKPVQHARKKKRMLPFASYHTIGLILLVQHACKKETHACHTIGLSLWVKIRVNTVVQGGSGMTVLPLFVLPSSSR
jgi:hypothetical protein